MSLLLLALACAGAGGVATAAPTPVWPRLDTFAPAPACATRLATDPATELLSLLNLSHPLLRRYLTERTHWTDDASDAVRVDVRLVTLIYGDQRAFGLRGPRGRTAFETFDAALRYWWLLPNVRRRALAGALVDEMAHLDWRIRRDLAGPTIWFEGFDARHAFLFDERFWWNRMSAWQFDVDDRRHVARDLHHRIQYLRGRLASDERLRQDLGARLARRFGAESLRNVTAPVRRFVTGYLAHVRRLPRPSEQLRREVREIMARQDISSRF